MRIRRKDIDRKLRLTAALVVAAAFSLRHPIDSFWKVVAAFKLWFEFARHPESTPQWIYYQRMRTCFKCPLFYRPLRTCGSPLTKELRDVGCFCSCEHKCSIADADCWAREHTDSDEFGWPDSLRPFADIRDGSTGTASRTNRTNGATTSNNPCRPCNGSSRTA